MVKGLVRSTYRVSDAYDGEAWKLLWDLQDELIEFIGHHHTITHWWLTEHSDRVKRLLELRDIQFVSDSLGIPEMVMRSWQRRN